MGQYVPFPFGEQTHGPANNGHYRFDLALGSQPVQCSEGGVPLRVGPVETCVSRQIGTTIGIASVAVTFLYILLRPHD